MLFSVISASFHSINPHGPCNSRVAPIGVWIVLSCRGSLLFVYRQHCLMTFSKETRDYEAIIVDSIDPLVLSCGCSLDEYGREWPGGI
jgi:hypothetical protein